MLKDLIVERAECLKAIESIKNLKKLPTFIYGAGCDALSLKGFLNNLSVTVEGYFVDREFINNNHAVSDTVLSLEDIASKYEKFNVVVGFHCQPSLLQEKLSLLDKYDSVDSVHVYDFTWWEVFHGYYLTDIAKNINKYQTVYDLLSDDLSKKIFVGFLNAKLTHDPSFLNNLQSEPQYFPNDLSIFTPRHDDIFIDGGAYDGDTLRTLLSITEGSGCHKYYAFEPDKQNYEDLSKFLLHNNIHFAKAFQKGLWSKDDTLFFHGSCGMASSISDSGEFEVAVTSIDTLGEDATFIKMDIEGAELEALKGASQTIKKNKPKLAISLYHDPKHLIDVPLFIKKMCPAYSFYLRLHSYFSRELVLYAVAQQSLGR